MFPDEGILAWTSCSRHGLLEEEPEALAGVILTHGHDDHIGALPHLLHKMRTPIYGTR